MQEQVRTIASFWNKSTARYWIMALSGAEELTEEETAVYHRGRNAKSYTSAKNASIADYRKATGLEALLGYLYLRGETDRLLMLVHRAFDKLEMEI